jgi:hypothetical protein
MFSGKTTPDSHKRAGADVVKDPVTGRGLPQKHCALLAAC